MRRSFDMNNSRLHIIKGTSFGPNLGQIRTGVDVYTCTAKGLTYCCLLGQHNYIYRERNAWVLCGQHIHSET